MAKTIREAYGEALVRLGAENPDVVVLDADVSNSTKTCLFAGVYPERHFNVGIAEANMMAMACGMAACGKIPFVNSFAVFLTSNGLLSARSLGSYSGLPIKIAGAYSGLSDAFDGPSHHALEDLAIMRALPGFEVYVASSEVQTAWLTEHAARTSSPVYMRLSREAFPEIYGPDEQFEPGKGKVLRRGGDLTIIACGLMTSKALEAAQILSRQGIAVTVVDMFSIKPLDEELILSCAKQTGAILTAEEGNVLGGLGGAVCETLCRNGAAVPVDMAGIADCHAECGPYASLQKKYGLDAETLVNKALTLLKKKHSI